MLGGRVSGCGCLGEVGNTPILGCGSGLMGVAVTNLLCNPLEIILLH